jgi:hypothetical protein
VVAGPEAEVVVVTAGPAVVVAAAVVVVVVVGVTTSKKPKKSQAPVVFHREGSRGTPTYSFIHTTTLTFDITSIPTKPPSLRLGNWTEFSEKFPPDVRLAFIHVVYLVWPETP